MCIVNCVTPENLPREMDESTTRLLFGLELCCCSMWIWYVLCLRTQKRATEVHTVNR